VGELRSLAADRPIVGRAVTVRLGPPTGAAPGRHLATAAVDASGPGDVIVVAHQGRTDCAGWGGLLSRAAVARGIDGVIVDGAARDLSEAAAAGLAVYARASTPVTARGRAVEYAWGESIQVGGVTVGPDDLVLADGGGVVVIPAGRVEDVLATAEAIMATEAAMAEAIGAGTPVSNVMGKSYEELTCDSH
jgi:4-hydroxy-4-methyl-2-oxoglutarate aldolase